MSVLTLLMGVLASKPNVTLASTFTANSDTTSPVNATAQYQLENDGDINATGGTNTVTDRGDWLAPKQNMSQFECRFHVTSGSLTSGTVDTWLNLGTTRTWTVTRSTDGTSTVVGTLEIGYAGLNTALKSCTVTITANRASP
jgi:predicted dehydrogenase